MLLSRPSHHFQGRTQTLPIFHMNHHHTKGCYYVAYHVIYHGMHVFWLLYLCLGDRGACEIIHTCSVSSGFICMLLIITLTGKSIILRHDSWKRIGLLFPSFIVSRKRSNSILSLLASRFDGCLSWTPTWMKYFIFACSLVCHLNTYFCPCLIKAMHLKSKL